jgi:hypothetical protein
MFITCNSPPPKKAKIMGKNMFILFMDRKGMLLTHAVPRGQTVNSEYYSKEKTIFSIRADKTLPPCSTSGSEYHLV